MVSARGELDIDRVGKKMDDVLLLVPRLLRINELERQKDDESKSESRDHTINSPCADRLALSRIERAGTRGFRHASSFFHGNAMIMGINISAPQNRRYFDAA